MTSKFAKNQYFRLRLSIPKTQGTFLDKVTPYIDGITDEAVVHLCDVQKIVENTFKDGSRKMVQMINRYK